MIGTRDDDVVLLSSCAERLKETDPGEAAALLRIVARLRLPQRRVSEYEIGLRTGAEDRALGRPRVGEPLLGMAHGREYIRGYADGYKEAA